MTPSGHGTAIIGAGLMGRWHADAVRHVGGTVTLIVDPNESARTALGQKFPAAKLAAELDASSVANAARIAHVCSPLTTHRGVMAELITAGIHVLAEKPFAENASDARSILDQATTRGVLVCPVHQFLFQDGVRQIISWIPELGPIRRVEFSTCSAGALGRDAAAQDALIAEVLPHPLSLVNELLRVQTADLDWQVAHPAAGEFRAIASAGQTVVDVAISANGRPTENVLRVIGDNGSAIADLFHGFATRQSPTVSRSSKMTRPFASSAQTFAAASANLAKRAMRGEPAYPGLRELVRAFYTAVDSDGQSPIAANAVADVAAARDRLLALTNR